MSERTPGRTVLGDRAVRFQALAGLTAQVTQGAGGIGIILVVREHVGSLAIAGAVLGALSIAAAAARPLQGRVIDAGGGAGLMALCGMVHPGALAGIVGLSLAHAPGWALIALGAVAGLALPPVSTAMRVAWGERFPSDDRTAAYSLVYLTQELSILAGPLLLSGLIALASAAVALLGVAAVSAVGTLAFAASIAGHGASRRARRKDRDRGRGVFRSPGMPALLTIAALVGGVVGGLEVATPVFASEHGAPALAGVLIALLSVGGIAGAVTYASRTWSAPPSRRLPALLAMLAGAAILMIPAGSAWLVGALMLLCGVSLNPALTTLSLLVERRAPSHAAAEGFGWLSTGFAGGTGAASAIAGMVAHHGHGARSAFVVAAGAGVAAGLLAVAARGRKESSGVTMVRR